MEVINDLQHATYIPMANNSMQVSLITGSDTSPSLRARLRTISNTYMKPSLAILLNLALLTATLYGTERVISKSVERVNNPPPASGIGAYLLSREIMNRGLVWGALGGMVFGVLSATLAKKFNAIRNWREAEYQPNRYLNIIGASLGLCVGGLAGFMYSVSRNSYSSMPHKA